MDLEDETLQMHLLHDYTTNSIKSQTIYKLLLDYLRTKNFRHFKCLVEQNLKKQPPIININYAYPNQSNETFLDIACKNGLSEFVKFLLEKGAKVNRINEVHNRGPIHFATENGHADVLSILLDEPTINPNLEVVQQTALHIAVKKNDLKCASLLLEKGASPNIPNNKGLTALHIAAMKDYRNMVNLILEKTKHALNLDTYKDYNDQTARQILEKKIPNISLPPIEKQNVNIHDLKYYLNANDEMNFLRCLKIVQNDMLNNDIETLIEMAVQKNFKEAIILLLERTKEIKCNLEKAANLAIQRGSPHILRQILETDIEVKSDLLLNACIELNIPHKGGSQDMSDRLECFNLILEREDVDVRCIDGKGNTPLHYAAKADCREAVTLLLEKGSYIAFALAFFILFKDGGNENFPDPGHSLFKTIIMLTGEFDANDIPFVSHPILSHFVFILFVFLIAIVLFNLLNGLAVSDTVNILEKAELVGLISRIRILAYIENVIIQAPFTHGSYCLICSNLLSGWRCNPLAFLIQKILLFPNYLNSGKLNVISYDSLETYENIIKQAKNILMKKGQESDNEKIFSKLEKLEKRFMTMEVILNSIKKKIENNNCNILEHEN
ncbi:transient receptor potential cation channel protein painless [Apis mellifera caucasica]|nr:transient receptor potential cation channel protein painless [Apis mellifera caucasica]KAG9436646.1 transient receptor potential cation channel protein painless [Apis mellifera carnica]